MKLILTLWLVVCFIVSSAQIPDHVYRPNIRSVTLTRYADIYSYPVMMLNSADQFELHFDDMDNDVKSYYYTYLLCNTDWTPSTLFTFDYIRGFQNVRISDYRTSSIAITRYTHYAGSSARPQLCSCSLWKLFTKGFFGWRHIQTGFYKAFFGSR
jgi:hypothetical protein